MGIRELTGASTRLRTAGLPALLLALAWLACPGNALAYRDGGCFLRPPLPNPPDVLGGVLLPAGDADEALARAWRLGIGTRSCRDPSGGWMEGAQLGPTAVIWRPDWPPGNLLGLPAVGVYPLLHDQGNWGCPGHATMNAPQPFGARQVVAAIAVVSDFDRACDGTVYVHGWPRMTFYLPCGPPFEVPWMGARARDIPLAYGRLRLLAPSDPEGLAARWLEQGGPRWVGITLEVDDVGAAASELRRRGVRVIAANDGYRPVLIVEPDGIGGTLLEVVPATPF